ncbi:MAG: ATP-dependent helicase UvrD/PcrA [Solirubrobacteraceae bacterium]|jgi:DNA helicase-2/ATP-dependent DNA helicase PcrA|nr:ATP-dependent helicase UvrD/PcrA [Solirubrobacteraceae bacterium]
MFDEDHASRPGRPHRWLDELNPEQRAAATHPGGPLLILAGAGTGKTTTLCSRVAWLIAGGVPAERILLLTFTRRAAREMIARARTLTDHAAPNAGPIVGGTFHSLAHRLVRLHASSLGLAPGFGVLDAGDAVDLLDLVRQEQGQAASPRRFPRPQTMLDIYSRTVNAQLPLEEVLAEAFPWNAQHREALGETFRAYGARKRALGVLDLDDLLLYWRALAADDVVGPRLADAYDHVLVDEYQDVNGLQVDIVRSLRATRREVTVVGDDFQAIYGFRAASARHILDFPTHFPDARTVTLERNYRSSHPILAVANAVSAQDRAGFPKVLWTERDGGTTPELVHPRDEAEQAGEVCDRVLAAREQGMELRSQAVLFRTGHDSALLELELNRRRIPFVKYGGLRYLEAAHVKDLVALLRLTDNPADEMSWFRLLQLLDGVGPIRARRVLEALRPPGGGAPDLGRWPVAADHLPPSAREHADALAAALARDSDDDPAGPRAERLCAALEPLIRLRYPDAAIRLIDLEQLVAAARGAEDLRHFVSELVLDPPTSTADLAGPPHLDEDYLVLSTVHSAKGLEWDAVHVIAAYDGNIPADMSTGSEEGIAEERRLFYVALTRARRSLAVYVPVRYYHRPGDDAHGYGKPSRFLSDAVQRLFTITRTVEAQAAGPGGADARPGRRIEVSVDALFG